MDGRTQLLASWGTPTEGPIINIYFDILQHRVALEIRLTGSIHFRPFIIKVEFSLFCQLDHFDWLLGSEFNNKFAQGFTMPLHKIFSWGRKQIQCIWVRSRFYLAFRLVCQVQKNPLSKRWYDQLEDAKINKRQKLKVHFKF